MLHYCVTNMPGAVGRTSTFALCNVTLPWALQIANRGIDAAAEDAAAGRPGDQSFTKAKSPTGPWPKRSAASRLRSDQLPYEFVIKCRQARTTMLTINFAPGRHRDGQRQRLAEDQGRGRGARRVRRALRGPRDERHRTPEVVRQYATTAAARGLKVIIAAAGGAAHLAGVVASHTTLPVIGIPVPTELAGGLDSLLSIVQMPGDVPVATVGVGGGGPRNAGLLAVQILALADPALQEKFAASTTGRQGRQGSVSKGCCERRTRRCTSLTLTPTRRTNL